MYMRLALREIKRSRKLFLFLILQLCVTFLAAIGCASVVSGQYWRYDAFKSIIGKEGWFVNTNLGLRIPEADAGTGRSGREILEKYLPDANIICTYSIFGDIFMDDAVLDIDSTVYDPELIDIMGAETEIAEGRWFAKNDGREIEAVISQNYYGLTEGDVVNLVAYAGEESIPIRIVGVLKEDSTVIKMNYSSDMVGYHNFLYNLQGDPGTQFLILQEEDFSRLAAANPQLKEILWPQGLLFIQYPDRISDEEKAGYDNFIADNLEIRLKETLETVDQKSKRYIKRQLNDIVPVLLVFCIMIVMSTVCVSVIEVRQHITNLSIYRIVGMSRKSCFLIQLCINIIILCLTMAVTAIAFIVMQRLGKDMIIWNTGILQTAVCAFIAVAWMILVFVVQSKVMNKHELWRMNI